MKSRFDAGLRALSAALPAALAAAGATASGTAAHDQEIVRTVGAGFTGAFRALDLVVASPALLLPLGTRALRGGLASAFVAGICGALAFDLARDLARVVPGALDRVFGARARGGAADSRGGPGDSPRLLSAVAAAAVLTALLAPAWQAEAAAPGGAVTGAMLVLFALRIGTAELPSTPPSPAGASPGAWVQPALLVLGLAASYEPLVFLAALAALAPRAFVALRLAQRDKKLRWDRGAVLRGAAAFGLGLAPLALGVGLARRPPEIAVAAPMFTLVEESGARSLASFALAEVGGLLLIVCAGGAALALFAARARRAALPLVLVVGVGALAVRLHAASGPSRFSPAVLVGLLAAYVLGAAMLGALVLAIARARVPFAEASAALVVVLELVLPVRAIDETSTRRDARAPYASEIWNDVAWGSAPPASVVLVADRGTMRRIASTRATGQMRGDLVIVPAYDVQGREGRRALVAEPKLAPLYRDMALGIRPEELSLAELGRQRAVLATFDPRWDRALSRHLVPVGLSARFEPEPRGASERKKALDGFLPSKERLVRVTVAKKDAELAAATAALLRARAVGMAATGERDLLSRALDDLRAFAPDDAVGAMLVRRIVTTKGPIDVRDLTP
ncbi:MAG: hypothetical protein KF795_26120 [Labilithrix sp.]|nr:hypothetical protein [Labilithrix sp.]